VNNVFCSGRCFFDWPIIRPEDRYRVSIIECDQTKKERKKKFLNMENFIIKSENVKLN